MATITAVFATDEVTLTGTTADTVNLTQRGAHKVLITNVSGATTLHMTLERGSAVATQGTLTVDTKPIDDRASQGTLTIAEPVTDGDTFTIDTTVYTLQTSLTQTANNIAIGGSEAQTKLNIVAAINGTGTPGTDYATGTPQHPTVTIAAFSGDDAVITAKTKGTGGDSIATTETFTHASNIFDDVTLGTTTAGAAADTMTIGSRTYTFRDTLSAADEIFIGANLAATKVNIVAAINDGINGSSAGTSYSQGTPENEVVTAAAFSGDDCVLTARQVGRRGDSVITEAIVTTETFDEASNIFDAATLGGTTAGVDPVPTTATAAVDRFMIPSGLTLELNAKAYGIAADGLLCSIVGNANVYAIQLVK